MPFTISHQPDLGLVYGAALQGGQGQYNERRRAEALQVAELQQRDLAQQRSIAAQQQAQASQQAYGAQQAFADRQFDAQRMQSGAQQQQQLQWQNQWGQAQQDQRQFLMQQYESGALQMDEGTRRKAMQIRSQMGAVRTAPNLTPQDRMQTLSRLDDEYWGLLSNPAPVLPGERQKSIQEKWQSEAVQVKGPNGEIHYVAPDRNGAFREVTGFDPPTPKASGGRGTIDPTISVTTIGVDGAPRAFTAAKTFDEIQAEQRAQRAVENTPTLTELEEIGSLPPGTPFQGPNGDFFERDNSPQGYHPIDHPMKGVYDAQQARATEMAANQAAMIQQAAAKKKAEDEAKRKAQAATQLETARRTFITGMMGKTKPQSDEDKTNGVAPKQYTAAEAATMWSEMQAAMNYEGPASGDPNQGSSAIGWDGTLPATSAGNIDLQNRPVVRNKDGSISTVRSISVGFPDGTYLLPTVSDDGRILSNEDAIAQFRSTGKHLGKFQDTASADAYAKKLSAQQAAAYGGNQAPSRPPPPPPTRAPDGSLQESPGGLPVIRRDAEGEQRLRALLELSPVVTYIDAQTGKFMRITR